MADLTRIDFMLSTLNALDVGTLESITDKLRQVEEALKGLGHEDLAVRATETGAALARGDMNEFRRGRAFLQAKIGHLR